VRRVVFGNSKRAKTTPYERDQLACQDRHENDEGHDHQNHQDQKTHQDYGLFPAIGTVCFPHGLLLCDLFSAANNNMLALTDAEFDIEPSSTVQVNG
jgi:hypothetical protein